MQEQSLWVWRIIVMVGILFTRRLNRRLNYGGGTDGIVGRGGKSGETKRRCGTNVKSWSIIVVGFNILVWVFCRGVCAVRELSTPTRLAKMKKFIVRSTSATERSLKLGNTILVKLKLWESVVVFNIIFWVTPKIRLNFRPQKFRIFLDQNSSKNSAV